MIKIHQSDTLWQMANFIIRNQKLTNKKVKYPIFVMYNKTESIRFYVDGIKERDNLVLDYCKMMKEINPKCDYYLTLD